MSATVKPLLLASIAKTAHATVKPLLLASFAPYAPPPDEDEDDDIVIIRRKRRQAALRLAEQLKENPA